MHVSSSNQNDCKPCSVVESRIKSWISEQFFLISLSILSTSLFHFKLRTLSSYLTISSVIIHVHFYSLHSPKVKMRENDGKYRNSKVVKWLVDRTETCTSSFPLLKTLAHPKRKKNLQSSFFFVKCKKKYIVVKKKSNRREYQDFVSYLCDLI